MAKYPWGESGFTMPFMFVCIFIAGLVTGGVLVSLGPENGKVADDFPSPKQVSGVAMVSAAFALVSYVLLGHQIGIKFATDVSPQVSESAKHIAERGVYNNIEQAIPFLILLWLHALFVNTHTSVVLGWIYVGMRYLYPLAYGFYGAFNNLVEFPQQFTYAIIYYFLLAVFYKGATGSDLHTDVAAKSPYLILLVTLAGNFMTLFVYLLGGQLGTVVIVKGVKWEVASKGETLLG